MKTLGPTSLATILRAYQAGLIIDQTTGAVPDASAGVVGAIALDSVSGNAYTKQAGGWVLTPGVDIRKFSY